MSPRSDRVGYLGAICDRVRLSVLEAELSDLKRAQRDFAPEADERLGRGRPVSRAQAAAFLGVSTKKVQRMEAAGTLHRCPDLGAVVLYSARDVLRLASAPRKEQ